MLSKLLVASRYLLVVALALSSPAFSAESPRTPRILTNQDFIEGLNADVDLNDPTDVFRVVFSALDEAIVLYPSENYYYFTTFLKGRLVQGNLALFADSRDSGTANFSYTYGYPQWNGPSEENSTDVFSSLDARDGVVIEKTGDLEYSISFEGKTIRAILNDIGVETPKRSKLLEFETYVGTSFDESGLQFHLIYNNEKAHLFWVLNEDDSVAEEFRSLADNTLWIGSRTGFAFFNDRDNSRRILVGVRAENAGRNNYYDGPFDQLPDNNIKSRRVKIKEYLEGSFPELEGKIDTYGNYLEDRDTRVSISSYYYYSEEKELTARILRHMRTSASKSELYCRITAWRAEQAMR